MLLSALALAFLPAAAVPAPAQSPAQAGLAEVRKLMEKRQWERAYGELRALLAAHEGSAEMMIESESIRVDMKRIVFWRKHQEPDPATLVSGKLTKLKDGKIEITYDYAALDADWDGKEGMMHWHAVFAGPYTVTIKLANYPASQPMHAMLAADEDPWIRISFGLKNPINGNSQFYPAAVDLMPRDGDEEELDRNDNIQVGANRPAEFKLAVTASKIVVHHDGKKILDAKRPKGPYGRFGLFGFTRNDEMMGLTLEIAGEIEPMWLQHKMDAAMEEVRTAFDAAYDEAQHLPAWLLAPRAAAARAPAADDAPQRPHPGPELEGDLRDAYRVAIDHLKYLGDEEGLAAQLAHVDELAAEGELAPALLDYLRLRVFADAGRFTDAIAAAERVLAADPAHLDTRVRRARLLARIGKAKEADAAWAETVAAFPGTVAAVEEYVWFLIERNDIGRASEVARAASFASAVAAARLDWLRKILLMADKGPAFERVYEHTSEHYVVRSDLSRELCAETARLLESAYTSYSVHLRRVDGSERNKFRVYLFSGEASYKRYADEAFGGSMENTAGVYSRLVKQLLIWNLPDADERRRTVIHEGFHQYLDALTRDAPRWFNEGLAQYYELADTVNGKFTTGQVDERALRVLDDAGTAPLTDFFRLDADGFMDAETVGRNYAQAWAFVHFLQHSGKPERAVFDRLFAGLCDGLAADAAVHAAFEGVDLDALEAAFLDYLETIAG
jgi:tetratricopeptide (TPR) repeat protein